MDPDRVPPTYDLAEIIAEPVDARQSREGVVHGRRERADGYLDELVDAEGHVLAQGSVRPGDVCAPESVADPCHGLRRPYPGKRLALDDEMARPVLEADHGARFRGEPYQDPVPDELEVAAGRR